MNGYSRSLDDLRPDFRAKANLWLSDATAAFIDVLITCTLRSEQTQARLWAIGRTYPGANIDMQHPMGHVVTNARAGQSAHQYGLALDFVIIAHGKADWSGNSEAWNEAIELAQKRGLQSLRPMESAHLQDPNWREIAGQTRI